MNEMENSGREARRGRVRDVIERLGLGALLLRTPANFAWYTGGANNRVDHASPIGVADVLVTSDAEYIVTNTIEGPRMREEQTAPYEVITYPWYEDPRAVWRSLAEGGRLGADLCMEGAVDVSAQLRPIRLVLDPDALDRYREVGRDVSSAMAETAESLRPGMTEYEAAANLLAACHRRRLNAPVVMAAADDRITRYRHPVSSANRVVHQRVMLVVCGERAGLYANLTRFVHFTEPDPEIQERFEACGVILRRMREEATRPGRSLAEAFGDCRRFYSELDFPEEWKMHHQGGLTGYASREVIATPQSEEMIEVNQAFAWNPSITGAKTEETFVVTEAGTEVLCPVSR